MSDQTVPNNTTTASRRDALKLAGAVAVGGAALAASSLPGVPGGGVDRASAAGAPSRFSVEIDGVLVAGFKSVEGLESETEVVEYKDGATHSRPGNLKANKVTLTRDWSNTSEFYKWRKTVLDGKTDRKSVSIIFRNDAGQELGRMNFFDCWPSKWTGPNLSTTSGRGTVTTESLDISWETMELKAS